MRKNFMKATAKLLAFVLIFALIFSGLQTLLRGKWPGKDIMGTLEAYEAAAPGSVDVLFVGSSNAFASINPLQLWQERGVTSFVLASAWQQVPASAYLLQEALKTQTPKLVCFEVRSTAYDPRTDEDKIHQLVDGRPLSADKWRGVQSMKWESDSMLYLMSPLLRFHTRWKSVTKQDVDYLLNKPIGGYNAKGYYATYNRVPVALDAYDEAVPEQEMRAENVAALDKIVALCREKGIELLFWKTPTEEWRKAYSDHVQAYADANGVPFLDTNPLAKEIGLDKENDFNDASHFNVWGARKFTAYLSEYLAGNYVLPDHRADAAVAAQWNADAAAYERTTIAEIDDIKQYFAKLDNENTVALLTFTPKARGEHGVQEKARAALAQVGLDGLANPEVAPPGKACIAVLDAGEIQYIASEEGAQNASIMLNGTAFSVRAAAGKPDVTVKIDYASVFESKATGVSVVVYDKEIGAVVDTVTFDVYREDCPPLRVRGE